MNIQMKNLYIMVRERERLFTCNTTCGRAWLVFISHPACVTHITGHEPDGGKILQLVFYTRHFGRQPSIIYESHEVGWVSDVVKWGGNFVIYALMHKEYIV